MPVSVEDIKAHLNVSASDDDDLILSKFGAAQAAIEDAIGQKLSEFDEVPEPINEALRQLTAHLYENREPYLVGMSAARVPWGVVDLITPYRRWVF